MTDNSDDYEDFFSDLEAANELEASSEQRLYNEVCAGGGGARIFNARYDLEHQLHLYHYITLGFGQELTKNKKPVTVREVASQILKYYYLMHMLPRFQHSQEHRKKVDIDKFIALVLEHPEIRRTINKDYSEHKN